MPQRNFWKYFLIFAGFTIVYVIFYSLKKAALEKEFLTAVALVPSIRDFGSGTVAVMQTLAHTWGLLAGIGLGLIAWLISLIILGILKLVRLAKFNLAHLIALFIIYGAYLVFATELLYYENRFTAIAIAIIIFVGRPLYYAAIAALILIIIVFLLSMILAKKKDVSGGAAKSAVFILLVVLAPFFLTGCSWLGGLENVGCGISSNSTHCFQEAAVSSGNANDCSKVSQPESFKAIGSNPPQDKCYLMVAENTANADACKNIKGGEMSYTQAECVTSVAAATEDIGVCQKLGGSDRQQCLAQVAPTVPAAEATSPNQSSESQAQPGAYPSSLAKNSSAAFTSLSREVEFSTDGGKTWEPAKPDTQLKEGYHVRTSEDSSAVIAFGDLTTFKLKPDSQIVITTPPSTDSKIALLAGNIWVNVKKMAHNGTMEVDMSQAVAGIKATTLVLSENGRNSTLKVVEGTVAFRSKADNKTTLIGTGEMIAADKSGSQPKQNFSVAAETKTWEAIRPAKSGMPISIYLWIGAGIAVVILAAVRYFKSVNK